ncbi:MAG: MvaI/BcnI restriction endonuclease family protein [Ktedonobacteraceae bacterium]|nr:MvaI/BcnI restriction endonuclease family protein [Ktedonobacteraceae bacterium]
MKVFTKESLIADLMEIYNMGWIRSDKSPKNNGAVGNKLEELLEMTENNLPLPNATEWEIKGQRRQTTSLLTLFHMDPSPQAMSLVNSLLVTQYGWPLRTRPKELSFRQTISTSAPSDRGFQVVINDVERKVGITFKAEAVAEKHKAWLQTVEKRVGLKELNPQPYWAFSDLAPKAGTKLKNTFYIVADSKVQDGIEYFWYNGILMLQEFDFDKFIEALRQGLLRIDFDARSGFEIPWHNHGTKYRLPSNLLPSFYGKVTVILDAPLEPQERLKRIDIAALRTPSEVEKAASEGPTVVQLPQNDGD